MAPPPPRRPGPVLKESPASGPLHNLQSELLSAKAAWEQLGVRIAKGYTVAYVSHSNTVKVLNEIKKAKLRAAQASLEAFMFVFSIVCIGFSGGTAGAILGPWVKRAGEKTARFVFREGVRGVIQQGAKEIAKWGDEKLNKLIVYEGDDPYSVNAPKDIAVDEDIRDRIASAFGPILEALDAMIDAANTMQASAAIGQEILNNFRQSCPLMTDKPGQDDIPALDTVAKMSELAMWVAWANEVVDWKEWNVVYSILDTAVRKAEKIDREGGGTGEWDVNAVDEASEMDPVGERMRALGKWADVKNFTDIFGSPEPYKATPVVYTDLRKLKSLKLELTTIPFRGLSGLSFQWDKMKPLEKVKFLSKFQTLKPPYK